VTSTSSRPGWIVFIALALVTIAVYWPAMHGGYLFDDTIYFVDNDDLHVTSMDLGDWWRAATSQCAANLLCRPLSLLSFSANYFFTGLDPFYPKLTNLSIHLINGLLVYLITRRLFSSSRVFDRDASSSDLTAATLAGAWLLLPINLSAVAYVSQRMECLATVFVLIGILTYLRSRQRMLDGTAGSSRVWLSVFGWTSIGLLAKEDAALLPLFTLCLELTLFHFRDQKKLVSRSVVSLYISVLIVPLIAGLIFVMPKLTSGVSQFREFTIAERLITEPRVIVDYIRWTLLPDLNVLTFYHDDLTLSRSLISPPTTLLAILSLTSLLAIAMWQRRRRALVSLGLLLFFAGHVMTGTIVPLELVFEHRNYFASIGLLIAIAALAREIQGKNAAAIKIALSIAFLSLYSLTTLLRAEEWSNPLKFAYSEALKRPDSPRAQYELARTLVVAAGTSTASPLLEEAERMVLHKVQLAHPDISALQVAIFIAASKGEPIDSQWWDSIDRELKSRPPSQSEIAAIIFLYHCQRDGPCPRQDERIYETFVAAMESSGTNVNLMSAYAEFALTRLNDAELAERMFREVVEDRPKVPVYRENLIRFLLAIGKFDAADVEVEDMAKLNTLGSLDKTLARWRERVKKARLDAVTATTAPQND
jgi:hypothetical protein